MVKEALTNSAEFSTRLIQKTAGVFLTVLMSAAKAGLLLLRHVGNAGEVCKTQPRHVVRRHQSVQLGVQGGHFLEAIVLLRPRVGV